MNGLLYGEEKIGREMRGPFKKMRTIGFGKPRFGEAVYFW